MFVLWRTLLFRKERHVLAVLASSLRDVIDCQDKAQAWELALEMSKRLVGQSRLGSQDTNSDGMIGLSARENQVRVVLVTHLAPSTIRDLDSSHDIDVHHRRPMRNRNVWDSGTGGSDRQILEQTSKIMASDRACRRLKSPMGKACRDKAFSMGLPLRASIRTNLWAARVATSP